MRTRLHNDERDTAGDDRLVSSAPINRARGGISPGSILTGMMVTVGVMALAGAAAATAAWLLDVDLQFRTEDTYRAGAAATAGFIALQFVAYLWGGYTAGRMARGAGAVNGVLVSLVMLIVGMGALAAGASAGNGAEVNFGSLATTLPIDRDVVIDAGIVLAVGSLTAMLLGGLIGGALGHRWHTRLEARDGTGVMVEDRHLATAAPASTTDSDVEGVDVLDGSAADRTIDLRDSDPAEPVEAAVERERGRTSV